MSTTTLRLPDVLKQRVTSLADRTGQTAHALMVEAIQEKADEIEWYMEMCDEAAARDAQMDVDGRVIEWHEMRSWLLARAAGKKVRAPRVTVLASRKPKT